MNVPAPLHGVLHNSEPFPTGYSIISNMCLSVPPRNHLGNGLGMFRLSKYGVHTYIHLRACLLWSSDAPPHLYPCDYSQSFLFFALFIVFCIYCTHLFSKIQVYTLPHSTESLRDTI